MFRKSAVQPGHNTPRAPTPKKAGGAGSRTRLSPEEEAQVRLMRIHMSGGQPSDTPPRTTLGTGSGSAGGARAAAYKPPVSPGFGSTETLPAHSTLGAMSTKKMSPADKAMERLRATRPEVVWSLAMGTPESTRAPPSAPRPRPSTGPEGTVAAVAGARQVSAPVGLGEHNVAVGRRSSSSDWSETPTPTLESGASTGSQQNPATPTGISSTTSSSPSLTTPPSAVRATESPAMSSTLPTGASLAQHVKKEAYGQGGNKVGW